MESRNYRIKFTPIASEDLEEIYRYISKELHAEGAAVNLLEKIEQSVMRLKDYPFSCNYVEDEFLKQKGYRKLIIGNYIVFYLIDEEKEQVNIMRILYGRQKYQSLL
jgi:addiction module RelE/StbE family toxin